MHNPIAPLANNLYYNYKYLIGYNYQYLNQDIVKPILYNIYL